MSVANATPTASLGQSPDAMAATLEPLADTCTYADAIQISPPTFTSK